MITENKKAPLFSLKDKDGEIHSLSDIATEYTIVYFYPKDNTPGCTVEAIMFSKNLPKFKKLNAEVMGISGGDEKTKTKFCEKHKLKVTLLSDPDFSISKKYGVYGEKSFLGKKYLGINRTTFLLDKNKKVIKVFPKVSPAIHTSEILDFIKKQK